MIKQTNTQTITKILQLFSITFFALLLVTKVNAATNTSNNPYQLIEHATNSAFKRIAAEQDKIQQNPNHLKVIVSEELMPYFDHRYAARVVLYKIKASKADRKAFYHAFEQYLITTYATVFTKYSNQKVLFGPQQSIEGKKMVTVKSRLTNPGDPDINIDFKVRKNKKTGIWKAYDLKAMGVSLLDSKKAELKGLLRQTNGVNTVAQQLMEKAAVDIVLNKA